MASTAMASAPSLALAGHASRLTRPSRERVACRRSAASTWRVSAARASNATMGLDVRDDQGEDDEEDARREPTPEELDAEARVLLQWPELSAQVRAFTATTLGYRACDPALPLGADFEASRRLLAELRPRRAGRAGRLQREAFEGTRDIRPGRATGRVLSGGSLADIATTTPPRTGVRAELGAAPARKRRRRRRARGGDAGSLRDLAEPLESIPATLEFEIRRCVAVPGGTVRDDASDTLREIREARRATETALRALLLEKAAFLARKNFAERAQVVIRLGRECIPMKAGAQSEMDGVVLGASGTGATVFKEPAEATPLNNRLMELAAEEEAKPSACAPPPSRSWRGPRRGAAARHAGARGPAARARNTQTGSRRRRRRLGWTTRPPERAAGNEARDSAALRLPGMQHPLLLQPCLPALPRGGKVGEDEEVDGWESGDDSEKAQEASEDEALEVTTPRVRTRAEATDVVPVDFCPPPDTRLVAITGPNTGGKTASLKALGLALLMARAGLHLPTNARETAAVPWTSRVLADLGDAQSLDLDGGLSTFSAHLTRLRRILAAARDTRDAVVVLLDEPGGGTDPAEGAALAAAVLRASAERSTLTVATSHYEEVKALAGGKKVKRDLLAPVGGEGEGEAPPPFPGAANAAVEFDTATLRPTYRLLWGTSGESNALAVARGLGLEAALADAAARRWRRGRAAAAPTPTPARPRRAPRAGARARGARGARCQGPGGAGQGAGHTRTSRVAAPRSFPCARAWRWAAAAAGRRGRGAERPGGGGDAEATTPPPTR